MGAADAGRSPTVARRMGPVALSVVMLALVGAILGTLLAGRLLPQPEQIMAAARSFVPAASTITETGENLGPALMVGDYFAFTRFSDGGLGRDLLGAVQATADEGDWRLVSDEDRPGGTILLYERAGTRARVTVFTNHRSVTGSAHVEAINEAARTDPMPATLWGAAAGGLLGGVLGFFGRRWRARRSAAAHAREAPPATAAPVPAALAPLWMRVVAAMIDIVVVWMLVSPFMLVALFAVGLAQNLGGEGVLFVAVAAIAVTAGLLYEPFFLARTGMTLGRMVFRLRVVHADGSLLSFSEASGRFGLKLISLLPLGIGFLVALRDPRRQTWYDRLSESVVVRGVAHGVSADQQRVPSPRDA